MAKPKSKLELNTAITENYNKLMVLLSSIPTSDYSRPFQLSTLNKNIKDIVAHLHEWHLMMMRWYDLGMQGRKPQMPAEGYTWSTLPDLNAAIQQKHQDDDYETILARFKQSHLDIMNIINKHTNNELFEKKRYHWTGSTSLGAYLTSNTSSHYNWAIKLMKKGIKSWNFENAN